MNVRYINPVLTSILHVLDAMAKIQAKPGKPVLKGDDIACGEVTGILSISNESHSVSFALTFAEATILEIAFRMLHQRLSQINPLVLDLTGELANMMTGGAKGLLEEQGFQFTMSLPAVVWGKAHIVAHKVTGPKILIPFKSDIGSFSVEICDGVPLIS